MLTIVLLFSVHKYNYVLEDWFSVELIISYSSNAGCVNS